MIPWYIWIVLALIAVSTLGSIAYIGKPRPPLAPGTVVGIVIANALIMWAIIEGVTR